MDKLPCPFCGSENAEIANCKQLEECSYFEECPADKPYVCVVCGIDKGGCGSSSGYYNSDAKAIAAWNRRAQPENKPLTLDELREMDGEPVWLDTGEVSIGEQIVGRWEILEKVTRVPREAFWFTRSKFGFTDFNHGKTWLAYRSKPKEDLQC